MWLDTATGAAPGARSSLSRECTRTHGRTQRSTELISIRLLRLVRRCAPGATRTHTGRVCSDIPLSVTHAHSRAGLHGHRNRSVSGE